MSQDRLEAATRFAREAGEILTERFLSSDLQTEEKGFLDVVTEADKKSEHHVAERIREAFPDDAVVGEEGTNTESANGYQWFIDPLDGTFNFSRGIPFWCVSIGVVKDAEPELGVILDPMRDELFTAIRGGGAFLNGEPIVTSGVTDLMEATLQLTLNFDRDRIDDSIQDFNAVAHDVMRLRNLGALALELAYVACGRLDAVCQRGSHAWDYAAGVVLCTEAGATVTDILGTPFKLDTDDGLVAATPELHRALGNLLNR
jgi:myo-inositol-1(or 4)-monophosphatase